MSLFAVFLSSGFVFCPGYFQPGDLLLLGVILYVQERLNTNVTNFWSPIPNLRLKTFASLSRKKQVKATVEKVVNISADRDLFGHLIICAKSREISLKEVLSYELSTVPYSLAYSDGSLRKPPKSSLLSEMEKSVNVLQKLPVEGRVNSTAFILDGMAFVHMLKAGGISTFGALAERQYDLMTASFGHNWCKRVDVVFDQYQNLSIKTEEHEKQGTSSGLEIKIHGP